MRIHAYDDTGRRFGPVTLTLGASQSVHLKSADLERGSVAKGLPVGIGNGSGWWRLVLETDLAVTPLAYVRTLDGFLTSLHDTAPVLDGRHWVPFFNPGSNTSKVSLLRLVNPGTAAAEVTISARDDAGDDAPGGLVRLTLPARASRLLSAQALEGGGDFDGYLGDGAGKWRLSVTSNATIEVMSLLTSGLGHITNLSTVPGVDDPSAPFLPFLPASDWAGPSALVRIINRSPRAGTVGVKTGRADGGHFLFIEAGQAVNLNSRDLEVGNAAKGFLFGLGESNLHRYLEFDSTLDIVALAYLRTTDGFLTSMHDMVPVAGHNHQVAFFNPGSNQQKLSLLWIVNRGSERANIEVFGIDDAGTPEATTQGYYLPPGAAGWLSATTLEEQLADGAGKWRLTVNVDRPVEVVNVLLSTGTGHLSNLSTVPPSDDGPITVANAAPLALGGGEVSGRLTGSDDVHYYEMTFDETTIVSMPITADPGVVVSVLDEDGNVPAQTASPAPGAAYARNAEGALPLPGDPGGSVLAQAISPKAGAAFSGDPQAAAVPALIFVAQLCIRYARPCAAAAGRTARKVIVRVVRHPRVKQAAYKIVAQAKRLRVWLEPISKLKPKHE